MPPGLLERCRKFTPGLGADGNRHRSTDRMTDKEKPMLAQGEQMQVDGPTAPGSAVAIRREPIPKELEALGVKIAVDGDSGMQILVIPKGLREKANVLTPVQAFQQADPNWRPSLRVVELDPDAKNGPHFYPQAGGRLAPRKQALELLADAAGLVEIRTMLAGRERVVIGEVTAETFTHTAIAKLRKSDGTLRVLEASRTYEPFAEYEEIRGAVGSGQYAKQPGTPEYDAELRKRWLNEIKFAKAKNESKAILRAIRSALQIPHTFTAAAAAKPFVVVGWNLAPQDTESVRTAIAQLYGAVPTMLERAPVTAGDWDLPESVVGEIEDDASEASGQQAPGEAGSPPAADPGASGPEDASGPEASVVREQPSAPDEQAPDLASGSDPGPISEPLIEGAVATVEPLSEEQLPALPAALAMKIPSGSYQSRSIEWVLNLGDAADQWLAYALRQSWPKDKAFVAALELACQAQRPALYAAWRAESAT